MKGNDYLSEIGEAKNSLKCLKSRFKDVYKFELPIEKATRAHILIQKLSETPKLYPRKAGLPNKQPL
jgi:16S rRNA (guanine527-N7)-methyltransferase